MEPDITHIRQHPAYGTHFRANLPTVRHTGRLIVEIEGAGNSLAHQAARLGMWDACAVGVFQRDYAAAQVKWDQFYGNPSNGYC